MDEINATSPADFGGLAPYTGALSPGGLPGIVQLSELTVAKLSVGPMDNNCYLLKCNATSQRLLIDAANEAERILDMLRHNDFVRGNELSTVVTTHRHHDHWYALGEILATTNATSVAHAADAPALPRVDITVADGDQITLGDCALEVIHLVGHTPGSIALLYRDPAGHPHLFTGDALFPGGPGRTTNPDDFNSLMDDIESKLFARLPDETWFYPGHGNDSTLGAERASIPQWRARGW